MKQTLAMFIVFTISIFSQNTYEFLRVDTNPRTAAMGGSFVAGNDDPDVIFYNPAGLNMLEKSPVSFSFLKYLLDVNFAGISFSKKFEDLGRFGAGIRYVNYGTFTRTDEYGNKFSDFGAGETVFLVSYGNELDENFYYGAGVKFIYSSLADYSSSALGFDVGLNYSIPSERWYFGFAITNMGTQLSSYVNTKEKLPVDMAFGLSKQLQHLPLRFYIDFHRLNRDAENFLNRFNAFTFGGEFTLSKVLKLRLGFDNEKRKELKIGNFAGLAGFNLGVGITIKTYQVNYAYSSLGQIGALHRFGISTTIEDSFGW